MAKLFFKLRMGVTFFFQTENGRNLFIGNLNIILSADEEEGGNLELQPTIDWLLYLFSGVKIRASSWLVDV